MNRADHNPAIDALRGAAILLVMLLHYSLSYRLHDSPLQALIPVGTLRTIFYNGNYGVSIFFVISGFLITTNVFRRYGSLARVDVMHFYRLRLFRLYPLVVMALLIIAALGAAGFSHFNNAIDHKPLGFGFFLLANFSVLTFWHNVLMENAGYFNYAMNIYWSLSVEEVFYLAYPLVLLVARRRWQLVVLATLCIVAAPVYRWVHRDDELFYLYGNVACLDMLAYGCIAAVIARAAVIRARMRRLLGGTLLVVMALVYMQGIPGNEALGASMLGVATAALLVCVSRGTSQRGGRLAAPLAWLGAHSYELYLFHIVVLGVMIDLVPRTAMAYGWKLPMLAVFLTVSAFSAWIAARFVGDPFNRYLRARYGELMRHSPAHPIPPAISPARGAPSGLPASEGTAGP